MHNLCAANTSACGRQGGDGLATARAVACGGHADASMRTRKTDRSAIQCPAPLTSENDRSTLLRTVILNAYEALAILC